MANAKRKEQTWNRKSFMENSGKAENRHERGWGVGEWNWVKLSIHTQFFGHFMARTLLYTQIYKCAECFDFNHFSINETHHQRPFYWSSQTLSSFLSLRGHKTLHLTLSPLILFINTIHPYLMPLHYFRCYFLFISILFHFFQLFSSFLFYLFILLFFPFR